MTKQNFINPEKVLLESGLKPGMTLADLGAGNGFFSLPAASIVGDQGTVFALDILEEALSKISAFARLRRQKNVRTFRHDLDGSGNSELEDLSCDFVIIGKILPQFSRPDNLVRETYRILKTGGTALIVEWKKEKSLLGPSYESRLAEEEVKNIFVKKGFKFYREFEPDKYHYVLLFQK